MAVGADSLKVIQKKEQIFHWIHLMTFSYLTYETNVVI